MSSKASPGRSKGRKRSHAPCYPCRTRKVRCETDLPGETDGYDASSKCTNCQRLGFQCQWGMPEPGEQYDPPPKRRRTIGQRRRRLDQVEPISAGQASGSEGGDQDSLTPVPGSGTWDSVAVGPGDSNTPNQPPWLPSDDLGDFALDFDFGSHFLDLNLGEEGFDFIPLPTLDPSTLQLSESTQAIQPHQGPQIGLISDKHISAEDSDESAAPCINDDNRRLIQHYLEVLKGFSKVEDRFKDADNLFISAFTRSLSFLPLFYAILGFSASHLSMNEPSYGEQARRFERLARESFNTFKRTHSSELEGFLSALFVRIKTIHVMGGSVDSFFGMNAEVVSLISTRQGEKALEDPNSLTRRIVLRLALLDARAGCFRLGGGALIERLQKSPALSFLFDFDAPITHSPGAALSLLRANILRKQVGDLDMQLHRQSKGEFVVSPPIRTERVHSLHRDIQREIARHEREMFNQRDTDILGKNVLDSPTYNYYTVSSALHSALLYLCQVFVSIKLKPDSSPLNIG